MERQRGFTLVEVLVATAVLSSGLLALAQLTVLSAMSNLGARDRSYSAILAAQKLDELAVADLAALPLSSPDAWMRTSPAAVELLDSAGRVVGRDSDPVGTAIYVRRWSVTPVPGDATGGLAIQVAAGRVRRDPSTATLVDARPEDVVRVVGLRTGVVP